MGSLPAGIDDLRPALLAGSRDLRQGEGGLACTVAIEHDEKMITVCPVAIEEKGQGVTFG